MLKELNKRGYATIGESGRHVIENQTKLHEDKIIRLDGRKIKLLDTERLESISKNG